MKLTHEANARLQDLARRAVARRNVPEARRLGVEYEIMSHLHAAAETHARAQAQPAVGIIHIDLALAELGGEHALVEAFVDPAAGPLRGASFLPRAFAYGIDVLLIALAEAGFAAIGILAFASTRGIPFLSIFTSDWASEWDNALDGAYGPTVMLSTIAILLLGIAVAIALPLAYFGWFESAKGRTPGKRVIGLRVVKLDGGPLTFLQALARNATKLVVFPVFPGGMILLIADTLGLLYQSENLRFSDRILGTLVIKE